MLPSLRDKAVIALCPDRLIAVRWHKGHVAAIAVLPVSGGVISSLSRLLAGEEFRNTDATVILSNHFMHFAVMPWNGAFLSGEEEMALAQHRFNETYGEATAWAIRLSAGAIGAPTLASAVAKDFLESITHLFASSGIKLKSIQPYLMAVFNACRRKLTKEPAWFVLVEQGLFCIALLRGGQWHRIRLLKSGSWDEALLALEREALLCEEDAGREIYLYAPKNPEWIAASGSWVMHALEMPSLPDILDAEYVMTAVGA